MALSLGASVRKIADIGEKAKRLASTSKNSDVQDLATIVAELCEVLGSALQRLRENE
jgi:hypothetical protein